MFTKVTLAGKHFFPVFLFIAIILASCSDNNVPTTPNNPPNTFCDVSGAFNMYYKGQGSIFGLVNPYGVMANTFYKDSTGKIYYMGINVYFKGGVNKTGTFNFIGKADPNLDDYAVSYFQTGEGAEKKTFISYNGSITITELTSGKFIATFSFSAQDEKQNTVIIKNGKLEIID